WGLGASEARSPRRSRGRALDGPPGEINESDRTPGRRDGGRADWRARREDAPRVRPDAESRPHGIARHPRPDAHDPARSPPPEGPGADVLCDLMERSRRLLAHHPVCASRLARGERAPTAIWLWGQGKRPQLPTLRERFGIQGAVIAAVDLVNGLGTLAGLRRI